MFSLTSSSKTRQVINAFLLMFVLVAAPLFPVSFAEAGTQTYSTPGTYSFTVPAYSTLTVKVWGGGGGGGAAVADGTEGYTTPASGGVSSFNGTMVANGGARGENDLDYESGIIGTGGTGGSAAGGDTNTTGASGENGSSYFGGDGGDAPNGGTGGTGGNYLADHGVISGSEGADGDAPGAGGGGSGWGFADNIAYVGLITAYYAGGGGGAGAYSEKTYSSGALTVSSFISVVVGAGGVGSLEDGNTAYNSGSGANGRVEITWTEAPTDTDPPTPDPMSFATDPNDTSTTSISMTATTSTDADGADPVEYLFSYVACASDAGTGGTSSAWQTSTSYVDSSLQPNHCYGYTITARDALGNTTVASNVVETYSAAMIPGAPTLASIGETKMIIQNDGNGNPSISPTTLFALKVSTTTPADASWDGKYIDASGAPSATAVWLSDSVWDDLLVTGLSPGTQYTLIAKAKNGDGDETVWSNAANRTTLESVTKTVRLLGNIRLLGGVRLR